MLLPYLLLLNPVAQFAPFDPDTPIAAIDFWGLRSVDRAAVVATLDCSVGDRLPADREAVAERIAALPGVEEARLMEIWMGPEPILLVGVREEGRGELELLPPPAGAARLPESIVAAYDRSMELLAEGIEARVFGEDRGDGYALSRYEPRREIQLGYHDFARDQGGLLRTVLRESADPKHRAVAATVLAHGGDKAAIARALSRAARDVDSGVRNNATRALGVLIEWAAERPELELDVDPAPFVAMLESIEWTDLNKASFVLMHLTEGADSRYCAPLRENALPGLADIARWQSRGHAYPALITLGRLAGRTDDETRAGIDATAEDRAARLELVEQLCADAATIAGGE